MNVIRRLRVLLLPLTLPYLAGVYLRRALSRPVRFRVPVLCIGNITTGGTGKTPFVMLAARALLDAGFRPGVVSRGYRGSRSKSGAVVSDGDAVLLTPAESGDEPYQIARTLPGIPVVIGADRRAAIEMMINRFGVDCVVMDDGFQNPTVFKNASVLIVDATDPFGGGLLLPAGNLREPSRALRRGDMLVLSKSDLVSPGRRDELLTQLRKRSGGRPVYSGHYRPMAVRRANDERITYAATFIAGKRVLLISGIGNPAGFRAMVSAWGPSSLSEIVYPDHHDYIADDIARLGDRRGDVDLVLTTEKDYIKMRRYPLPDSLHYVAIDVEIDDRTGCIDGLVSMMRTARDGRKNIP